MSGQRCPKLKRARKPTATNGEPKNFLAAVYKIWMMRHIDVPEEVSTALEKELAKSSERNASRRGQRGVRKYAQSGAAKANERTSPKYIPVVAVVNGRSARVTLVPAGGGRFRMQINTALRKAARVDAGDIVEVELRLDLESRELPVPPDLRDGLKAIPKARKAFEALTPAHRRHFIQWFDSAKSPEARQRRLDRAVDVLLEHALIKPRRRAAKASRTAARRP
jgi:hypothetical protein